MRKIAVFTLFSVSFFSLFQESTVSAGRCWVAGQVTCCLTPEGVICH